jgi:hypothetical protein
VQFVSSEADAEALRICSEESVRPVTCHTKEEQGAILCFQTQGLTVWDFLHVNANDGRCM